MQPIFTPGVFDRGAAAWQDASRLLVVQLDRWGDVLAAAPAFGALGNGAGRHVTLLASRAGAALKNHLPAIDEVLVYEAPWVKGRLRSGSADRRFLGKLASHRFDAAIVFGARSQSALPAALFCRMAGIALRLAQCRENPYGLLTDWLPDTGNDGPESLHVDVERHLALVRSVGFDAQGPVPPFRCHEADAWSAQRKLDEAGGNHREPYVIVHPGCLQVSRGAMPERFGHAAQMIADRTGAQIVFTGNVDEQNDAARAQSSMRTSSVSLAGALTVGELAALIRGAAAIVCGDEGATLLAAAVQTPVVPMGVDLDAVIASIQAALAHRVEQPAPALEQRSA
jgi:ADP-heptose:LPS heptosyltransferase